MDNTNKQINAQITIFHFPTITISLIIINIIIFLLLPLYHTNSSQTESQVLQYLSRNHPECVIHVSKQQQDNCIIDNYYNSKYIQDAESVKIACSYKLNPKCRLQKQLLKKYFSSGRMVIYQKFGFTPQKISAMYTLFTAMFLHASKWHLFINMLILFLVGMGLEHRLEKKKFLLLFLLSGIIANLFLYICNPHGTLPAIGASGAIFGVLGANLALNFFRQDIYKNTASKFLWISFHGFKTRFLLIVISLQIFWALVSISPLIAYTAHIGGFIAGFILALFLRNKQETYSPDPIR